MGNTSGLDVHVQFNPNEVKQRFSKNYTQAQKWLDNEILKDSSPFVPMDTGILDESGITGTNIGSGLIVYNTPYASKQYYEFPNKAKDKHPKATIQWFEVTKSINSKKWINGVKKRGGR